jgi:hypothetical protein
LSAPGGGVCIAKEVGCEGRQLCCRYIPLRHQAGLSWTCTRPRRSSDSAEFKVRGCSGKAVAPSLHRKSLTKHAGQQIPRNAARAPRWWRSPVKSRRSSAAPQGYWRVASMRTQACFTRGHSVQFRTHIGHSASNHHPACIPLKADTLLGGAGKAVTSASNPPRVVPATADRRGRVCNSAARGGRVMFHRGQWRIDGERPIAAYRARNTESRRRRRPGGRCCHRFVRVAGVRTERCRGRRGVAARRGEERVRGLKPARQCAHRVRQCRKCGQRNSHVKTPKFGGWT